MNKNHADNHNIGNRTTQWYLDFLSCTFEELLDLPIDADIYSYVARALHQLIGHDAIIIINSFDLEKNTFTIQACDGEKTWQDVVEKTLRHPLRGLSFSLPPNAIIPLMSGECHELIGGFSALTFGNVPNEPCRDIESMPFFGKVFDTGISRNGVLHGSALFILPQGKDLENQKNISAFLRGISGLLQRRKHESEGGDQYSSLQAIINSVKTPIFSLDTAYRYTNFNTRHAELMKALYDADIKIGHSLLEYMTVEEDRVKAQHNIDRALQGEQFIDEDYSGEDDRTRLFFKISHNPIRNARGEITGVAVYARDFTQRRNSERALKKSEDTATALMNATTESALLIDTSGIILAANRITAERLGYPHNDIVGKNAYSLIPPDLSASRKHWIEHVTRTKKPVQFEDIRHGRVVENNISPVMDEDGNVIRLAIFGRDITDRKNAETVLRESEQRLQLAMHAAEMGIWTWDLSTNTRRIFIGKQTIFGYSEAEIEEYFNTIELREHPADTARWGGIPNTIRNIKNQEVDEFELRIFAKDGTWKTLQVKGSIVKRNHKGDPLFLVGTFQDVTARKVAEEALRESENRYRSFVQKFRGIAYQATADWIPAFFHGSVEEITGYTEQDFLCGVPRWDQVIHPEDLAKIQTRDNELLLSVAGHKIQREYRIIRKDGQIRWLSDFIQNRIEDDGTLILTGILTDITERKQADEFVGILARMVDDAPASITVHDFEGNFLYANEETFRLHGYSREEFLKKDLHEIDVPESEHLIARRMQQIRSTGMAEFDVLHFHKDGSKFPLRVNAKIVDWGGREVLLSIATDTTERQRIELALRSSEEKYREVVERAHDGIVIAQGNRLVFANTAFAKMSGYPADEIMGMEFLRCVTPEMRDMIADRVKQRLAGEDVPATYEIDLIRKDGTRFLVEVNAGAIDYDGVPSDLVIVRDITERKRAEELLQESTRRLSTLIANLQGMVYRCRNDPDWTMEYISEGCTLLTGYSPQDYQEKKTVTFSAIIHPHDREYVWTGVQEAIAKHEPFRLKYRIIPRNEDEKWVWEFGRGVFSDTGELLALEGYIADITAQQKAEEEVKKVHALLNETQAITKLGGWEYEVASSKLTWTDEVYRIHGVGHDYNPNDVNKVIGFYTPKDAPIIEQAFHHAVNDGVPYDLELEFVRSDGGHIWVRTMGRPVLENGCVVRVTGNIVDITERKRAEIALHLVNQKLNLLSGITRHDIRNQLTVLSSYLELSKGSLDNPARTRDYIGKEERAVDAISHQLTFTKDYEDMGVRAPTWQGVNAAVNTVVARLPMRDIRVDAGDPDLEIFADPLLEKVFYNLIDNALRYGGETMTSIRVTHRANDEGLIVALEDDGVGISMEDKMKIFTKGYGKHTGLGLFLSSEILSITDITITENGEPGKGARFEMTIPQGSYRWSSE